MTSQRRTLEFFTALSLLQPSWAGTLLLGIGLDETGRALALASLAAGVAGLFLEEDQVPLRTASREGCTTFTVTTLDEALRALKNEIRQGRAITVGLNGDPDAWLCEMVERGVQPEYLAQICSADKTNVDALQTRGTRILLGFGLYVYPDAANLEQFTAMASNEGWHIAETPAPTLRERRAQDTWMLTTLSGDDRITSLTRQWLRAAPTLFPRALNRAVWTKTPTA